MSGEVSIEKLSPCPCCGSQDVKWYSLGIIECRNCDRFASKRFWDKLTASVAEAEHKAKEVERLKIDVEYWREKYEEMFLEVERSRCRVKKV